VRGGAQDPDATASVFDHDEDVHPRSGQPDRLQKIAGQQGVGLGAQEAAQVLAARSGAGSIPASRRISLRLRLEEFARDDLFGDRWAAP
jgi:hypothetical protein